MQFDDLIACEYTANEAVDGLIGGRDEAPLHPPPRRSKRMVHLDTRQSFIVKSIACP